MASGAAQPAPASRAPTRLALAAFSAPAVGTGMLGSAIVGILPAIYATSFHVALAFIGLVLVLGRVVDAVVDPFIGYLSDRTRLRFGRRRSWLSVGIVVFTASSYALLRPPSQPGQAYVLAWYVAFFFGWALIEIPHAAWASELSREPRTRTRVITYRQIATGVGAVTFALAPWIPGAGGGQMTPGVLAGMGVAVLVTMPLLGVLSLVSVEDPPMAAQGPVPSALPVLHAAWTNGPFRMFVGIFVIAGVGYGMYGGLYFLYVQTYLGIGKSISLILILMVVLPFISLPLWMHLIQRVGKLRAWAIGLMLVAAMNIGMALIRPGPWAETQYLAVLGVMGLCAGANSVVPYALLADIIDYDTLKSGERRAGSYYAVFMLILKINLAAGAGLGFVLLQALGYDATATSHSAASVVALKLCTLIVPAALMAASALWVLRFPIDEGRHAIIRRRLDQREARTGYSMEAAQ